MIFMFERMVTLHLHNALVLIKKWLELFKG